MSETKQGTGLRMAGLLALAVVAWASVFVALVTAPAEASADRDRDVRAMHARAAKIPASVFEADPGLRIDGTVVAQSRGPARVVAVEARELAQGVARAGRVPEGCMPFVLPIAAEAQVDGRGRFQLAGLELGRYAVFVFAQGSRPLRHSGIIVRDSIGARATVTLRAQSSVSVTLPPEVAEGSLVLPVYAGHWPDLTWSQPEGRSLQLASRDPDGLPQAILWKHGDRAGWCRVVEGEDGATHLRPTTREALLEGCAIGPGAISSSTFAALASVVAHVPVEVRQGPATPDGFSAGLEVQSREPFAHYEVELESGQILSMFADGSGTGMLLCPPGRALVRAVVRGGQRTRPTGVFLRSETAVSTHLPFADLLEERLAIPRARVEMPVRQGVYGFVVEPDGSPVVGATIAAYDGDPDLSRPRMVASNEHGFFRIDGLKQWVSCTVRYGRTAGFGDSLRQHEFELKPSALDRPEQTRVDLILAGGESQVPVPKGRVGDLVLVRSSGGEELLARVFVREAGRPVVLRDLPVDSYRLTLERESVPIAEAELQPHRGGDGLSLVGEWRSL